MVHYELLKTQLSTVSSRAGSSVGEMMKEITRTCLEVANNVKKVDSCMGRYGRKADHTV